MIWPVGQPHGLLHQLALQSRAVWLEVLEAAHLPYWPEGSLHAVYEEDEAAVARDFAEVAPRLGYQCAWLNADQVLAKSSPVQPRGLIGALWSETELTVDPRVTLREMPRYLAKKFGIEIRFGSCVHGIEPSLVETGSECWRADHIIICSGDDFESLYPDVYAQSGLARVKLDAAHRTASERMAAGTRACRQAHTSLLSVLWRLRHSAGTQAAYCDEIVRIGMIGTRSGFKALARSKTRVVRIEMNGTREVVRC